METRDTDAPCYISGKKIQEFCLSYARILFTGQSRSSAALRKRKGRQRRGEVGGGERLEKAPEQTPQTV